MRWQPDNPPPELARRARVAMCAWKRIAEGLFLWGGKLGDVWWCVYVSRSGSGWIGHAYRLVEA